MTDAYIDPDREAWETFKSLPRDEPIQMLNMIKLKDKAEYPEGHPNHGKAMSGRAAYKAYGEAIAPIIARVGARRLWAAAPQVVLTGPQDEVWDSVFVVEYPNSAAFMEMVRDPHYREQVVVHRTAGVADSRLVRMKALPSSERLPD